MFLRVIAKSVLACIICILLAAPSAYAQTRKQQVGVFVFRFDDLYISLVSKHLEKSLHDKLKVSFFDAKQNQIMQLGQIAEFVKNGGDAIIVNLVDVKFGQDVLNIASRENIPVIFFNKQPDLSTFSEYSQAAYVGSKANQSGVLQGEIIANLWKENAIFDINKDGICNFLLLQGNVDNPEALVRSRNSVLRARALGVKMQQLGDTLICDWDVNCAYNTIKAAFKKYENQVDFIISNNDGMALGAIKFLQEQGFNLEGGDKVIPVVGIDGTDEAKAAIRKNIMHGTVIQDADSMANVIAKMALNSLNKKPFLEELPFAWNDDKVSVSIPYKLYQPE